MISDILTPEEWDACWMDSNGQGKLRAYDRALRAERDRYKERLEEVLSQLVIPSSLHTYGPGGIHRYPDCLACSMLPGVRAALTASADTTGEEPK